MQDYSTVGVTQQTITTYAHPLTALQMASHRTVHWMANGLILVCALKLVVVALRPERVASLPLPMAARIVKATRLKRVTRELAQVRHVGE